MKLAVLSLVALFAGVAAIASSSAASANPPACVAPEYRQFDFWIGDWDAFDIDNPHTALAHARVDRILDGCVLLEDYQGANGSHGESFSVYDVSRRVWHQTWVTNRGRLLVIEGTLEAGAMVLSGSDRQVDGKQRLVRGTWKPVSGGVRETAVTSSDGGKTWNLWFDLIFRPHAH
ncbi:MAG TPA: hypothetical protein VHU83_18085 [Bryobacteraceae bacterium]|jgi:hypothetical protein|nr:hypothetical protein [Bryobacteraceae bacterium]